MKNTKTKSICVYGIGNDSRSDDGLGWAFLKRLESEIPNLDVFYRYQLMVEDADEIQNYDHVVFVDAYAGKLKDGYELKNCRMSKIGSFSTHGIHPGELLKIGYDIFNFSPKAWLFMIAGDEWGFSSNLSKTGQKNLDDAIVFFKKWIKDFKMDTIETKTI